MCRLPATVAAIAFLSWPAAALAQSDDDGWRFRIEPYLLVPSMDGDVTVRGREAEADVGPEDIFSHLNLGFQGYFEARGPAWGVAVDAIYMNLDATDDARIAEIDVEQVAITPTVFVRVTPRFDLYAGARYNSLGGDIDFQGPAGLGTFAQDKDWLDPLVGARYSAPIGDKWSFEIAGDVGGFGLGSDIAVNLWPMVGYQVSRGAQLTFGYRVLYMDYDSGSGADRFSYDVLTTGPVIGAAIDF